METAKNHLDYFTNFSEFRAWVALNMKWERRARLVFAIHGVGREFNGGLICAPFLEFQDRHDDDDMRAMLAPIADEGFIFFHDETKETVLRRMRSWRERVLRVAIGALKDNL